MSADGSAGREYKPDFDGRGWFKCCAHCGCFADDRTGHDDMCAQGCNDAELSLSEATS